MEMKKVDLTTINNGAAVELFQEEFTKVMRNINDISVDRDAEREITLKFKIKPSKDGMSAMTRIQATSKLVAIAVHESSMFIAASGNDAYVTDQRQMGLDFNNKESQEQKPQE